MEQQYLMTYDYENSDEKTDSNFLIFDLENNPINPKVNGWNKKFYKIQEVENSEDLVKKLEKLQIIGQIKDLECKLARL